MIFGGLIALLGSLPGQASTLLSYWNFNNDATAFAGPNFGTFSTADAGFGEVYNAATKTLSANSASGVYTSSSLNFSPMNGTANSGNTGATGWGVFTDATAGLGTGQTSNASAGDASPQVGSLIFFPSYTTNNTDSMVFNLDTQGYQGISLSFVGRYGGITTSAPTFAWSYSLDNGTSWLSLAPTTTGALSGASKFYNVSAAFNSVLDNASSIEVKLSVSALAGQSVEMDNVQVLAASAVPEPSVLGLLGGALALLAAGAQARRRTGRSRTLGAVAA